MKNLTLIRHAKSSWDFPLSDIDRPLSHRGIKDALLISNHIHKLIPQKFVVWSSIAKRTIETSYIFAQNLLFPIENIIYKKDLYTFDSRELEKSIKSCENRFDNIIIFCHNDAITNFVNKFGDTNIDNVPTSGFVQLQFDVIDWKDLTKGKTLHFLYPKKFRHQTINESIH